MQKWRQRGEKAEAKAEALLSEVEALKQAMTGMENRHLLELLHNAEARVSQLEAANKARVSQLEAENKARVSQLEARVFQLVEEKKAPGRHRMCVNKWSDHQGLFVKPTKMRKPDDVDRGLGLFAAKASKMAISWASSLGRL